MRIREAIGFVLFGRPVRGGSRGTDGLVRDLAVAGRLMAADPGAASDRLVAALGPDLLRAVERRLELEGRLMPTERCPARAPRRAA